MSHPLIQVEEWAEALLSRLSPAEQRTVNTKVGQALRRSQAQRIASQRNPDGSGFEPRRTSKNLRGKRGRIKRRAMFAKLRTSRYLRVQASGSGVAVGFFGRVARIGRVHQRGLNDRPAAGMEDVRYARRELLGFTQPDIELIRDTLAAHLAGITL